MQKKVWLLVLLFALGVLVGLGATTVMAQEPTTPPNTGNITWVEMRQACINGDYEAMQKLHNEYCGENGTAGGMMGSQGGMMGNGGMMNGGMMGGGRGGMMGGGWGGMRGNW